MTVVIWDSVDADIKFFITEKDVSHLNHKYVNSTEISEEENEEISSLVYNEEGQQITEMFTEFPVLAIKEGVNVIVTGFLP